ncbi:putative RxLR effector [Phytophthora palmivora]|uniref:RxLR effector protein n=1 Tax=Phytophthora palmivora TaxID=4796 RepID=A0A2P4XBG5_9STRA|nr:putative RxLR effector [Phytophthora palmivora]
MRLSCALLIVTTTATLLTSGKAAVTDSVRKSDISTMASPDAVNAIGTTQNIGGEKRFLRYRNNEVLGDEIEDEDEERGLFDAKSLKALTREADSLTYTELKGTGVKRFFNSLKKSYNPVNVPIPEEYTKLRTLYHSWYYHHYIPKLQRRGLA